MKGNNMKKLTISLLSISLVLTAFAENTYEITNSRLHRFSTSVKEGNGGTIARIESEETAGGNIIFNAHSSSSIPFVQMFYTPPKGEGIQSLSFKARSDKPASLRVALPKDAEWSECVSQYIALTGQGWQTIKIDLSDTHVSRGEISDQIYFYREQPGYTGDYQALKLVVKDFVFSDKKVSQTAAAPAAPQAKASTFEGAPADAYVITATRFQRFSNSIKNGDGTITKLPDAEGVGGTFTFEDHKKKDAPFVQMFYAQPANRENKALVFEARAAKKTGLTIVMPAVGFKGETREEVEIKGGNQWHTIRIDLTDTKAGEGNLCEQLFFYHKSSRFSGGNVDGETISVRNFYFE